MSRLFPESASRILPGVLTAIAVLAAGCGGSDSYPSQAKIPPEICNCPAIPAESVGTVASQDYQSGAPVDPTLVAANNNFGLSVLNTMLSQGTPGNPAIGSVALAETLAAAYNGAAGTTQQSMAQVLQLGSLSTQQLNAGNAALQGALINPDPYVTLLIYNSLWAGFGDTPLLDSFDQVMSNDYGTGVENLTSLSVSTDGSASLAATNNAEQLNGGASFETYRLVDNILGASSYTALSNTVLTTSAVYFRAVWTYPFNPALSVSGTFTTGSGAQTSAMLMTEGIDAPVTQGSNFQVLSLPYGKNARLTMLLVLPEIGTDLNTVMAGVTAATIEQWEAEAQVLPVTLTLPRFTSSSTGSVQSALTSLGMGVAFDSNNASFSGILPGAYLDGVLQGAVVSVNEDGTGVSAPGPVETDPVQTGPTTPLSLGMMFDRPFFYAIRDNQTGELLVIGVVTDPGSG